MTDIVERLRAWPVLTDPGDDPHRLIDKDVRLYLEAADAIEKLRGLLIELDYEIRAAIYKKIETSKIPIDHCPLDAEFLDRRIDQIDFGKIVTTRIATAFQGKTVREVVRIPEYQLYWEPNVGRATVERLKAKLAAHGLHFGMDI